MRILVIGGTHGGERTGVNVVSHLRRERISDVDTLIANPRATKRHCRFTETDLNKSFGVTIPDSYEEKRAAKIVNVLGQYDLILEFHNTVSTGSCVILTAQEPSKMQLQIAAHFGFKRVVITRPGGKSLSSRNPQKTVSFEISTREKRFSTSYFVEKIRTIPNGLWPQETDWLSVKMYRRNERKVNKSELAVLDMSIDEFVDFIPFNPQQLKLLNLNGKFSPFLVGEYEKVDPDFAFNVVEETTVEYTEEGGL